MKTFTLSYLEVPLSEQGLTANGNLNLEKFNNSKLKDNMWLTSKDLYQVKKVKFEEIIMFIKSDYRQYSSFEFANNTKKSENWSNDNQDLIILDVDDGLTLEEAKRIFKPYQYLIATTKSHRIDKKGVKCDRFRVIMPSFDIPKGDDYFKFTSLLEKKYPFTDKQVNTKTGAFLGYADCEYWYNDGAPFECKPILDLGERLQRATKPIPIAKPIAKPTHHNNQNNNIDVIEIKRYLTREIVADIVSSCGYQVNRKFMFKYRQSERTPSASISQDLLIKDFGSDLSTDVIGFVMESRGVNFIDAVNYIKDFIGGVA